MSTEANKAIGRRVLEIFSRGNLDDLDEVIDPNVVDHTLRPGESPGLGGLKQAVQALRAAFPDLQWIVEDEIAEGDKVVARSTFRGTHHGEFMGIAGTGKQFSISQIDIIRVVNGKVTDHWGASDDLGLLQQLGVIPTPGQPGT